MRARVRDAWPPAFAEPLAYPLFTGGKRIRPALCVAAWQALANDPGRLELVLPAAVAVELIHTYSLVHDDLPSMDDDDERRGRPTVHVAFDAATAVLVGDALLTEAFAVLAEGPWAHGVRANLVSSLSRSAGFRGMVGGQAADIGLGGPIADVDVLTRLHRQKTGALIGWATVAGGLVAGADADQQQILAVYGDNLGLAFQLADDLLDAEEDAGEDGPPSFVTLLGPEETSQRARALAETAAQVVSELPRPGALVALARFAVDRDR
ncbi:MAG: polyprenyl synthetase family protein [Deltaproteobacteria bacterium]|nr:polyprenyl synthetase family protein [Deltaproteobacteria bacterium]MBW2253005.1 polyprenyl synthetase family protein [Deltaproteobacteria bacterium]